MQIDQRLVVKGALMWKTFVWVIFKYNQSARWKLIFTSRPSSNLLSINILPDEIDFVKSHTNYQSLVASHQHNGTTAQTAINTGCNVRGSVSKSSVAHTYFRRCSAMFLDLSNLSAITIALPTIQKQFGVNMSDLQWIISAYALTVYSPMYILKKRWVTS